MLSYYIYMSLKLKTVVESVLHGKMERPSNIAMLLECLLLAAYVTCTSALVSKEFSARKLSI